MPIEVNWVTADESEFIATQEDAMVIGGSQGIDGAGGADTLVALAAATDPFTGAPYIAAPTVAAMADWVRKAGHGQALYVDDFIAAAGQKSGIGDNTTPLLAAHAALAAAGPGTALIYGSRAYNTTAALPLPIFYLWAVVGLGWPVINQCTPNTPIFDLAADESMGLFRIENFRGQWGTLQEDGSVVPRTAVVHAGDEDHAFAPWGEIQSIMIRFSSGPSAEANNDIAGKNPLYNGIYQFSLKHIHSENGYRTISRKPGDTYTPDFTLWGYYGEKWSSGPAQTGSIINHKSSVGGPFIFINGIYANRPNAVEPMVHMFGEGGVIIKNAEVNNCKDTQFIFDICNDITIWWRVENAQITQNGAAFMIVNGAMINAVMEAAFTSVSLGEGVTEGYGVQAYGGAHIDLAPSASRGVRDAADTNGFFLCRPTASTDFNSSIRLTRRPQYRWEFVAPQAFTYRPEEAEFIVFPSGQDFAWWMEGLEASIVSDTDVDGNPVIGGRRCANGAPSGKHLMPHDGYITAITSAISADMAAGQLFLQLFRTRDGISTPMSELYTFHYVGGDRRQTKRVVVPFDPVIPDMNVRRGDALHFAVATSSDFDLDGASIEAALTVSQLPGSTEIQIAVLQKLELDSYATATTAFSAGIFKKHAGSTLSLIEDVGGKYTLGGSGEARTLVGAGLSAGTDAPVIRETLAGAIGNPRNTIFAIVVT